MQVPLLGDWKEGFTACVETSMGDIIYSSLDFRNSGDWHSRVDFRRNECISTFPRVLN